MRITESTSDSNMKVFLLSIFCALSGYAAGGAVGWPGAVALSEPVLKTVVPGVTKSTGYSTTQYINSLPSYSFGGHPQLSYQVPQLNSFAGFPAGYYPIESPSYFPATSVIYPGHPSLFPAYEETSFPGVSIIPGFPSAPSFPGSPSAPSFPGSPVPISPSYPVELPNGQSPSEAGDEDSAVIESADNFRQGNFLTQNQPSTTQQSQPAAPQIPSSNTFPNPSNLEPQPPQGPTPSFPQQPPNPQNLQDIAHNPTNFLQQPLGPSFPQPENSKPSFPYFTPTSQTPQASTPDFPQSPQTSQNSQASEPPSAQQPHLPQTPQDSKPSTSYLPQISETPQNSLPQYNQIPQNAQGTAPTYPQQPQINQNPQGSTQFYPQIGQNPQGPSQAPSQSGQNVPQYPQLTQDFGQNVFSEGPSQSFPSSFPGANTDSSSLNDEDTISVESA